MALARAAVPRARVPGHVCGAGASGPGSERYLVTAKQLMYLFWKYFASIILHI
jgi:hypothetical protein